MLTALVDITARQRAEHALRETERRFAHAFHANPLPMSITRLRDGVHLDVNEAAVRHSGYTRQEMLGRAKAELGFWVSGPQREDLLRVLQTEGRARDFEVTFRTKAGEERQLRAAVTVVAAGAVNSAVLLLRSATDACPEGVANRSGVVLKAKMMRRSAVR